MKKLYLYALLAFSAFVFAGCRFADDENISIQENVPVKMTVQQAQAIITDAFNNPPAGRRPRNPGWDTLAQINSIKFKKHNRTDFYLINLNRNGKTLVSFYVFDKSAVYQFADALRCIKKEYSADVK